jgi:hypothetical protein
MLWQGLRRIPPPAINAPDSSRIRLWYEFAAVTASYVLVVFVLCPGTRLIATPVHHDDFSNLAHTKYMWYAWRPVSYEVLLTLSQLGISVYYSTLHVLIIVYAFLSLCVLRRLLGVPNLPALVLLPVAAAMLSYERTVEYSKYTGLITNLLSGVFAVSAMALMVACAMPRKGPPSPGYITVAAVWMSAALSFWSKEDFLPPVLFLAAYLTWQIHADGRLESRSLVRRWFVMLAGLAVEMVLLFLYNRDVHSAFTESVSGSYKPDFALLSILRTAFTYIVMTPGAKMAFLLAASTLVWNCFASNPIQWSRLLAFLALASAIALPYLCLPNHVFPYYALNWTVWEAGGGLLAIWKLWPGKRSGAAIAILAVACLIVTQPGRAVISVWYSERAEVNRNILKSLATHRAGLEPYPAVVVEGAPLYGPWFGNTGDFLKNRLHLDHVWLVRVPKDGAYWQSSWGLLGTDIIGDIKTVAAETEPVSPDMPVVKLSADGTVSVDYPAR